MAKKILKFALSPIAAVVGAVAGKKKAKPAVAEGPKVMPLADDNAVLQARKKSIAAQMQRSGRTSTMLTTDSDTLGG